MNYYSSRFLAIFLHFSSCSVKFLTLASIFRVVACSLCLASCTSKSLCNYDALFEACRKGDLERVEQCAKEGELFYFVNDQGESPRHIAKLSGNLSVAAFIEHSQFERWFQQQNMEEATFRNAIDFDNALIVKAMVQKGADINAPDAKGLVPLAQCLFSGSFDVATVLLEAGADANEVFDFRPLLAISAMFGEEELTRLLLAHGAKVNEPDGPGVTPLMFAAEYGYLDIVKLLLDHGANPVITDKQGKTAYDKAKENQHTAVANLLEGVSKNSF